MYKRQEIEGIKRSAEVNVGVLDYVAERITPGITTEQIDQWVHDYTVEHGAIPAPLDYEGFPKSVCTSVNEVVCHGIPSPDEVLREGDIVNIDCSTIKDDFFSDSSRMFCIGEVSPDAADLVRVTKEAVQVGLDAIKPWGHLGDIGAAVNAYAREHGYTVVREFGGHGIGLEFHEDPFVSFVTEAGTGPILVPGLCFTIEPMINAGAQEIDMTDPNGWTVRTADRSLTAQWEVQLVITEDGYILTNYHVIDGANSIKVTFSDGKEYTATYVGGEEKNDIAVIKVDATGLTPVVIGKSSDMLVGEQVTTIGNPLGELTFSESTGIISALDRTITMSDGTQMNMIQTDCAINSGNSGGPLFNNHGEVIGIVSAKYSSSGSNSSASVEGLGFAIPMDDVANMVSELVTNGYVTGKPILGISVEDVSENVQSYGVPAGAIVRAVTPSLCGEKAGLQVGDIITKIDDKEVSSASELIAAKDTYKPDDTITLTVFRNGETTTVKVTLEESTPEKEALQEKAQQQATQEQQQQQQQQQGSGGWPFGSFGY